MHQLTPELALDFSRADLVALVDASQGLAAGAFIVERLTPSGSSPSTLTHRMEPSSLVTLARELYGRAPEVYVVSVGVAWLKRLVTVSSAALEGALPRRASMPSRNWSPPGSAPAPVVEHSGA